MLTYWQSDVFVDGQSKCTTGKDTLPLALADVVTMAIYYQAQYPDSVVSYSLSERCAECHNEGSVRNYSRKRLTLKRCPNCKGKLAQGAVDSVAFTMPDCANGIRLVVG